VYPAGHAGAVALHEAFPFVIHFPVAKSHFSPSPICICALLSLMSAPTVQAQNVVPFIMPEVSHWEYPDSVHCELLVHAWEILAIVVVVVVSQQAKWKAAAESLATVRPLLPFFS
jgi:hypothetical protein